MQQHIAIERKILNRVLNNAHDFSSVSSVLKPKHFDDVRSKIFKLALSHYTTYNKYPTLDDIELAITNVAGKSRAEMLNEFAHIRNERTEVNSESFCDNVVKFVRDKICWHALALYADALALDDEEQKLKARASLDEIETIKLNIDVGINFYDDDIIEYYSSLRSGLQTQYKTLNDKIGGFLPGTLSLVMASAHVGKSMLLTDLAVGFIKQRKNVLVVTLEMSEQEILMRIHANTLNTPISIFTPSLFTTNKDKFIETRNKTKDKIGECWVKSMPACNSRDIDNLLEQFKTQGIEFDAVIVDYLGIMSSYSVSPSIGTYSYIKRIAEELRKVAQIRKVPIISASQLNRSAVNNTNADNQAISDSFGTAMTADLIVLLLQTEDIKKEKRIVVKITKNRFTGNTTTFMMGVDYDFMRFVDLDNEVITFEQTENIYNDAENLFNDIMAADIQNAITRDKLHQAPSAIESFIDVINDL